MSPLTEEFTAEISEAVEKLAASAEGPSSDDKPNDDGGAHSEAQDESRDGQDNAQGDDAEGDAGGDDASSQVGDDAGEDGSQDGDAGQPALSDAVLSRAVRAGIDLDVARQFSSDDALLRVVAGVEKAATPKAQPSSEDKPADKKAEAKDPLADFPKLDPEQYDDEVIKAFDAIKSVVRQQHEQLQKFAAYQEKIAAETSDAAAREIETWFDKQVESLGDDFTDALGNGAYSALDRGSSQYAKRDAIANQMAVLLAGYKAAGQQAPPREQVFDAAARLVLRDEFAKAHEKKLSAELAKRAGQHVKRAANSGGKARGSLSPLEETAAELDRRFFAK